jgi:hypothetical protein
MIYQAYKSFGKMTTVTIKNIFLDQNTRTQKGYGFIHFETIEGARTAVDEGACLLIGGVNYKAEFSKHLRKRGERKMTNSGIEAQSQDIPSRNAGIQWGYPPSPVHNVPQFPAHSGPQFPGHHAPQFPSGNYGVYAVPIDILLLFSLMTGVLSTRIFQQFLSNALQCIAMARPIWR